MRNGTLAGVDVRDDALTGADVGKSTLQTVPSANTAHRADAADTAGRADHAESANVATNIAAPEGFHEIGAAVEPSSTRAVRTPFPRSCRSAFARTTNASFTSTAATPVPTPARPRSTSRPSTGPRAARSTPRLACFGGDQCPDSLTAAVNTFGGGVVPGADGGVTAVATEVSLDGVSSRAAGCRNVSTTGRNAVRPECPWIVQGGISSAAPHAPAADETQSSRRVLTSRLLRPADASVGQASNSTLEPRPPRRLRPATGHASFMPLRQTCNGAATLLVPRSRRIAPTHLSANAGPCRSPGSPDVSLKWRAPAGLHGAESRDNQSEKGRRSRAPRAIAPLRGRRRRRNIPRASSTSACWTRGRRRLIAVRCASVLDSRRSGALRSPRCRRQLRSRSTVVLRVPKRGPRCPRARCPPDWRRRSRRRRPRC